MSQLVRQKCPECHRTIASTSRFCPYCGASMATRNEPDEIVISGDNRLSVSCDTLNLRALLGIIESSVNWWQHHLQSVEDVNRERAAAAIKDLSRVFESLSQQLAQGRETVRITTRLPTTRIYTVGCPVCGHGNREGARFCKACGTLLPEPPPRQSRPGEEGWQLKTVARSDTGKVREQNEDTCLATRVQRSSGRPVTLLLVADGMGGAQAGEEASRLASDTAWEMLTTQLHTRQPVQDEEWHDLLQAVVLAANEAVYGRATSDQSYSGMGTTLTIVVVAETRAHIAHVGDSRAYLFNAHGVTEDGATLMQLTSDHSLVARLVDIGQLTPEQARTHPQRNMIYRVLGTQPTLEVDTSSQPLHGGDALLLCSDGLTSHIENQEIASMMLKHHDDPEQAADLLIALANQRGGRDNISIVLGMVEGREQHAPL